MTKADFTTYDVPSEPGVYFFVKKMNADDAASKGATDTEIQEFSGRVMYVGKATSLRERVRSYFSDDLLQARGPQVQKVINEVDHLEWRVTDSTLEALVLEAALIKRLQPIGNTKERANTSFNWLIITDEEWPRLIVMREREIVMGQYDWKIKKQFGPFTSGSTLREALAIIRKIFPFREGKSRAPHHDRFYRQLGLAPDTTNEAAQARYQNIIRNVSLFFQGKKSKVIKELEREMKQAAEDMDFEYAAKLRNRILALQHLRDVSLIKDEAVSAGTLFRIEGYDIAHTSGKEVVGVMTVVDGGDAQKAEYRKFIIRDSPGINDTKALQEVLRRRLDHVEWSLPRLIVVDGGKAQYNATKKVLEEVGSAIPVIGVKKDEHHRPKEIIGDEPYRQQYESEALLVNSEAHRFGLTWHRQRRAGKLR